MNRIADIFFLFGLVLIFLTFKTTDFVTVFALLPFILDDSTFFLFDAYNTINLIAFFLFIGSIGKSAQIGFHTWLPDAMEGPTPVSALLHAATMVTAGVFLIIRCSFFFELSEGILSLIFLFGSITTFFSGFIALFQYDIKKVIAYSTCSQLGYMFISCGLSNYSVALFHLFNHAFFKALLFLSAGYIIHAFNDEQDMRKYGGFLLKIMPFTYFCFLLGSLAIMGFPFLTGFYSKEVIIEFAFKSYVIDSEFLYATSVASACLTGLYSWRLLLYCFVNPHVNAHKRTYYYLVGHKPEFFDYMFLSMLCLCFCSVTFGFLFSDIMINLGTPLWGNSIHVLPSHNNL
jgi:proton-translocating NADH-quinone oxidoreductase chain L